MEHKTYSGEFGDVHYWLKGQGDGCIVFTHGATMDHGLFQHQIDFFSQAYKVILWDVPAHGKSRPYDGFTLQKAANDLIGILNSEDIPQAHLVGQSMGGYINQIVARDYQERVLSFTAVGSSPIQPSYYSSLDMWLLSVTPPILKLFPYNRLIKTFTTQIAFQEAAHTYALEALKGYSKTEIADIMAAVYKGVDEYGNDTPLSVPTLITFGDADKTGKVQAYSRKWANNEGRPLKIVPNASHNANMDNPAEFNRILDEFLKTL